MKFNNRQVSNNFRVVHRYLGFFLAGIMAVYSVSGMILVFRDTDFLKKVTVHEKVIDTSLSAEELGKALEMRRFKVDKQEGDVMFFRDGQYNSTTGDVTYTEKKMPYFLDKMIHLHKSKSADPLFFLNIFFGLSLFFFVISSFWMFMPSAPVFKKGLYFTAGGIILTLILLFV